MACIKNSLCRLLVAKKYLNLSSNMTEESLSILDLPATLFVIPEVGKLSHGCFPSFTKFFSLPIIIFCLAVELLCDNAHPFALIIHCELSIFRY